MTAPKRVQLRRVKGYRKPVDAVVVTRSSKSFGNPYRLDGKQDFIAASVAVEWFQSYAVKRLITEPDWLEPLRGRDLACYCQPMWPCHADVLLVLANRGAGDDQ